MKIYKKVVAIILATIWVSMSEFARNQLLFKSYWVEHYKTLGLTFPAEAVNGGMWGVWSFLFAVLIFIIAKKFNVLMTAFTAWLAGFVMMWIVIGNLGVLPFCILVYAVPLSIVEALVAVLIIKSLDKQ